MAFQCVPRLIAVLLAVCAAAPAGAVTVDGDLADWNVTIQDWTTSCGSSAASSCHSSSFASVGLTQGLAVAFDEDTNDVNNSYFLGPNHGGQNYDVEFMAAAVQDGRLYLAISSGQRPDNGTQLYSPGDIHIRVDGIATYGIEVGGGAPGGPGTAIDETADGTTYALNGSGFTTGSVDGPSRKAGSIWSNVTWIADAVDGSDDVQFVANGGSVQLGTADYVFTRNSSTAQHSFIELSFDLSLLPGLVPGSSVVEIQWGASCGNDIGLVSLTPETGDVPVPAPAALLLLLSGLAGVGVARRRRRRV